MRISKVVDFEEKKYSNLVDDIYFYLYSNYKQVVMEEGLELVTLNEFINSLLEDIEDYKIERKNQVKYKIKR